MTTIAYRNGVLAGDSACTEDTVHCHSLRKIFRLHDGTLFGFAGKVPAALRWLEWFDNNDDEPEPTLRECTVLRVISGGAVWVYERNQVVKPQCPDYVAIGTGSELALGAMAHGAGAVAAVRAACKHDAMSRGPVVSLRLRTR